MTLSSPGMGGMDYNHTSPPIHYKIPRQPQEENSPFRIPSNHNAGRGSSNDVKHSQLVVPPPVPTSVEKIETVHVKPGPQKSFRRIVAVNPPSLSDVPNKISARARSRIGLGDNATFSNFEPYQDNAPDNSGEIDLLTDRTMLVRAIIGTVRSRIGNFRGRKLTSDELARIVSSAVRESGVKNAVRLSPVYTDVYKAARTYLDKALGNKRKRKSRTIDLKRRRSREQMERLAQAQFSLSPDERHERTFEEPQYPPTLEKAVQEGYLSTERDETPRHKVYPEAFFISDSFEYERQRLMNLYPEFFVDDSVPDDTSLDDPPVTGETSLRFF